MAIIISASIDVTKVDKSRLEQGKYLQINIVVNDETDDKGYGKDVAIIEGQTKEERENKATKKYIGNGITIWTNGTVPKIAKEKPKKGAAPSAPAPTPTESSPTDDLPF